MENDYWPIIKKTFIECWPPALRALSIPSTDVALPLQQAELLAHAIEHCLDGEPISTAEMDTLNEVADVIDNEIKQFPGQQAFVRLGSRSPKDSYEGYKKEYRVTTGHEAVELFLESERVMEDLYQAVAHDYEPSIWIREWKDIPPWSEFRCFMRHRKLGGISQYNYHDGLMPEIAKYAKEIKESIRHWFVVDFRPGLLHIPSVVFDVWVSPNPFDASGRRFRVQLIEINPFCPEASLMTDPCLYSWANGGDFDYGFRYCTEPKAEPDLEGLLEVGCE